MNYSAYAKNPFYFPQRTDNSFEIERKLAEFCDAVWKVNPYMERDFDELFVRAYDLLDFASRLPYSQGCYVRNTAAKICLTRFWQ